MIHGDLVSDKFASGYVSKGEFLIWLRPILGAGDFIPIAKSLVPDFAEGNEHPHLETSEERQERRYDLCIKAGLSIPTDTYAHLPRGIGKLAHAEGISTVAFSKDIKAYIERKS
jgi:hypothetical protein